MDRLARGIERIVPRLPPAAMAVLLALMVLGAALPAFTSLPPVDRDEALFAQATKQMVVSGDPIDIHYQTGHRYKKPIGIYWIQAAAVSALGGAGDRTIWHYRLPSLAAALLSVLMAARIAGGFGGRMAGLTGGMLLSGVFLLLAEAHLATTDACLLAAILAAQLVLARLYRSAGGAGCAVEPLPWAPVAQFWGALAASVLLKGPVGLMVVGLTALALAGAHRRWRWLLALRPGPGVAGFLLLVLPWFIAITVKSGGAFWAEALGHDLLGKVVAAQESHGAPPGSYLAALWVTFFPASIPLALSLPALWAARRQPGVIFALAWVTPSWLVFEASPTKLIHYVLPLYPGLALAVALVWAGVVQGGARRWQGIVAGALIVPPVAILIAAAAYGVRLGALPVVPLGLALVVFGLGALLARAAFLARLQMATLIGLWLTGGAFAGGFLGIAVAIPALWPARAIAAYAVPTPACPARPIVAQGYDEPSLVFLAPISALGLTAPDAARAMEADRCTVAAVADSAAFEATAQALGLHPKVAARIDALDLGNGKPLRLTVYTAR
ncbi:MAG: glycosyltransferase family 39 protein [Paracoccaceae bacterium]|nr:glycosyltransferase family 39 protein [Paracoccaceae bacterium]